MGLLRTEHYALKGDSTGVELKRGLAGWQGIVFQETVFLGFWRTLGAKLCSSEWFLLTRGGNSGINRRLG